MNNTPEFTKMLEILKPDIERLVRKVDEFPRAALSGFVFSMTPKGFIKIGNIDNKGDDLVRLHLALSSLAAEMIDNGKNYGDVPFAEVTAGEQPLGRAPEEIADELARAVLTSGMEPEYANKSLGLALQYLKSRKPKENDEKTPPSL